MFNAVNTTLFTDDYGEIDIRIKAEHPTSVEDFDSAKVYSVWNSENEPLGLFIRRGDELKYESNELNWAEQQQVSDFNKAYRGGQWDL